MCGASWVEAGQIFEGIVTAIANLTRCRPLVPRIACGCAPTGNGRPPSRPRRDSVRSVKEVAARLPDDYWRWKPGQTRTYHSSAEEVAYFKSNQAPALGTSSELRLGHHIALTVCSACHGAALDGKGEDAGGLEAALQYDDAQFQRLLTDSVSRDGRQLKMEWGFGHEVIPLTQAEKSAAINYARTWARRRAR